MIPNILNVRKQGAGQVYTSKTDMFYLGELYNRLLKQLNEPDYLDFSYQDIVEKMMEKRPQNRFESFADIKEAMKKHDFVNMKITDGDKKIYQAFANRVYQTLSSFIDEQVFNYDTSVFINKLEKAIRNNLFEDVIQKNADIISSIVSGGYRYNNHVDIPCSIVKDFLKWFKSSKPQSQILILTNIISKLSTIDIVVSEPEMPF